MKATKTKRIEIDHLTVLEALAELSVDDVGLGYNSGGVSYYWTLRRFLDGTAEIVVEDRLRLRVSSGRIAAAGPLPTTAFVATEVARQTGNDAIALLGLLGR